jgi:hypothetical protein
VALEPTNSEARFELAEVRRARGKNRQADDGLRELELRREGHRLAGLAYRRADARARASASFFTDVSSDKGYGGRRLLELRQIGGVVADTWGSNRGLEVAFQGERVEAVTNDSGLFGARAGGAITQRLNDTVRVAASATRLAFGSDVATWGGSASLEWSPADRWTTSVGMNQVPVLDTMATVVARMVAWGPRGGVQFTTPQASWSVSGSWQQLSDQNVRQQIEVSGTRVLFERLPGLRAIGWAQQTWNRRTAVDYFAPASFTRVDGGAEYTAMLARPRFRGDRESSVTAGYLLGADARGFVYHHPYGRTSIELRDAVVMDAQAELITSRDYRHTRWTVAVRVGGTAAGSARF